MFSRLLRAAVTALVGGGILLGQDPNVEDAIAAGGCLACGGSMLLIPVIILAINVALLFWVYNDSKSRGMDNALVWVILVLFTSVIGLVIYLVTRKPGVLIPCRHCGRKRMEGSIQCPHCGVA